MAHLSVDVRANPVIAGIGWKVASAFVFTIMLTLVRLLEDRVPVGQTLFFRNFVGIVPVVVMIAVDGTLRQALVTKNPVGHAKRAFAGVMAMGLWFYALRHLTFPEATAIVYASPLILVILAATVLGERVRVHRWSAVAVGFLGVLFVLAPQLSDGLDVSRNLQLAAALSALAAAFFMALASMFVRELTATEATGTIVLYFFLAASGLSLLTLPFGWVVPSAGDLAILLGIGVLGGIGQLMLTQAYRHAEASTIAPFAYTSMVWAIAFGFAVFSEVPTIHVVVGSLVLIASGLYVIHRERQLGLKRTEAKVGAPLRS